MAPLQSLSLQRQTSSEPPCSELEAALRDCDRYRKSVADLRIENAALRSAADCAKEEQDGLIVALRIDNRRLREEVLSLRRESARLLHIHGVPSADAPPLFGSVDGEETSADEDEESAFDKENYSPEGRRAAVIGPLTEISATRVFNVLSERPMSDLEEDDTDDDDEPTENLAPAAIDHNATLTGHASSTAEGLEGLAAPPGGPDSPDLARAEEEDRTADHAAPPPPLPMIHITAEPR